VVCHSLFAFFDKNFTFGRPLRSKCQQERLNLEILMSSQVMILILSACELESKRDIHFTKLVWAEDIKPRNKSMDAN
jgi:hypothetical protein